MVSSPSDERTNTATSTGQLVAIASCRHKCLMHTLSKSVCRNSKQIRRANQEIEIADLKARYSNAQFSLVEARHNRFARVAARKNDPHDIAAPRCVGGRVERRIDPSIASV